MDATLTIDSVVGFENRIERGEERRSPIEMVKEQLEKYGKSYADAYSKMKNKVFNWIEAQQANLLNSNYAAKSADSAAQPSSTKYVGQISQQVLKILTKRIDIQRAYGLKAQKSQVNLVFHRGGGPIVNYSNNAAVLYRKKDEE